MCNRIWNSTATFRQMRKLINKPRFEGEMTPENHGQENKNHHVKPPKIKIIDLVFIQNLKTMVTVFGPETVFTTPN